MTHRAKCPTMLLAASVVAGALISALKAIPGTRAPNVAESIPRGTNRSGIILSW